MYRALKEKAKIVVIFKAMYKNVPIAIQINLKKKHVQYSYFTFMDGGYELTYYVNFKNFTTLSFC